MLTIELSPNHAYESKVRRDSILHSSPNHGSSRSATLQAKAAGGQGRPRNLTYECKSLPSLRSPGPRLHCVSLQICHRWQISDIKSSCSTSLRVCVAVCIHNQVSCISTNSSIKPMLHNAYDNVLHKTYSQQTAVSPSCQSSHKFSFSSN